MVIGGVLGGAGAWQWQAKAHTAQLALARQQLAAGTAQGCGRGLGRHAHVVEPTGRRLLCGLGLAQVVDVGLERTGIGSALRSQCLEVRRAATLAGLHRGVGVGDRRADQVHQDLVAHRAGDGQVGFRARKRRMFGARAAVELIKAILKFSLVAVVLWSLVSRQMDQMMQMGQMALEPALAAAGWMIGESALWLSLSLLVIALIDAPYQRYSFIKRMRMTKQEVKDEMKDMEGRPEVKQQIRRRQRDANGARAVEFDLHGGHVLGDESEGGAGCDAELERHRASQADGKTPSITCVYITADLGIRPKLRYERPVFRD